MNDRQPISNRFNPGLRLGVGLGVVAMAAVCAPAQAADPLYVGVQAPITGQYANEGQGIADAVKLLVKQQNAKDGLLGRQPK